MKRYYTIKFLKQDFKKNKLIKEVAAAAITLKACSENEAFEKAEFLLNINNPEIVYNCMTLKIDYSANRFEYMIFK